mmetsp:Transcript_17099/g.29270  ORF Transcript_17099/g.29270 Transcript_17099/m.29270 type:complete len:246 (+) Transcript_17099:1075-1812(+)
MLPPPCSPCCCCLGLCTESSSASVDPRKRLLPGGGGGGSGSDGPRDPRGFRRRRRSGEPALVGRRRRGFRRHFYQSQRRRLDWGWRQRRRRRRRLRAFSHQASDSDGSRPRRQPRGRVAWLSAAFPGGARPGGRGHAICASARGGPGPGENCRRKDAVSAPFCVQRRGRQQRRLWRFSGRGRRSHCPARVHSSAGSCPLRPRTRWSCKCLELELTQICTAQKPLLWVDEVHAACDAQKVEHALEL